VQTALQLAANAPPELRAQHEGELEALEMVMRRNLVLWKAEARACT
jgi:hypothetical protein